jgi:hypothetical protein
LATQAEVSHKLAKEFPIGDVPTKGVFQVLMRAQFSSVQHRSEK